MTNVQADNHTAILADPERLALIHQLDLVDSLPEEVFDRLRRLPVIVLTTSQEDQDRFDTFELGVSGYMLKPVDYSQFVDVVRTIHTYWALSERSE